MTGAAAKKRLAPITVREPCVLSSRWSQITKAAVEWAGNS